MPWRLPWKKNAGIEAALKFIPYFVDRKFLSVVR